MLRALYVGRFQPIHKGHAKVVKYIIEKVDELIIIIGSAEQSHQLDNPFTAGERVMMVKATLNEMKIDPSKYYIIPVPDATIHSVWVSKVRSFAPSFSIAYSNEPLTSRLFKEFGIKHEETPFFKREIYSATEVRRRMLTGENWKELLFESAVKVIENIDGVARLKELAQKDFK